MVVLGWVVRGSFGDVLGAVLKAVGADRKGRGGKDGVVLLLCGSSGVERAHNLSGGGVPLGGVEAEETSQRLKL